MSLRPGAAVDVRVPASSANLGPGFDSIGLALGVFDDYRAIVREEPGLVVDLGEDAQGVPVDETHLVVATLLRCLDALGEERPAGLELVCRNTIRMGRGMGSSAAAIVAGAALADALRRGEASAAEPGTEIPLDLAFVGDVAAALEGHPDNSSASVFGGMTVSWVEDDVAPHAGPWPRVHTTCLTPHPDVEPVVLVPTSRLSTHTARAALPAQVPHAHAALNAARAALLTHALTSEPASLLPATRDWLHQEQRREAYAESMALVDALREQGHAAAISGAGPSVLVLATRAAAADLQAPEGGATTWQCLRPGVPSVGVVAVRATLGASLGERAAVRRVDL
ncbi:homoserine kinase [Mobilicoccus pelagius]|uniref:Homoserine kinase n=1 Tax=Mobilicoccus pelagius NBRC 104925 TaxID=1089455 RepID=H5UMT5_9MICO|nr:homoserine kinase [Mobilicoccus pelagius]GAB47043.1 homoserine kinase [Mobilicoccus pelagius NBRC 104925]